MVFLRNLIWFFIGFLPLVAIFSMILSNLPGDRARSPEGWNLGWNPVLWLIVTAPWLLLTVVIVPILHFIGNSTVRRFSRPMARGILMVSAPVLFMAALLILWGWDNFRWEFVLPTAAAGLMYGAWLRIPQNSVSK